MSDIKIPEIGLGTWKSAPQQAGAAVEYALTETGYDHIDCAAIYMNEPEIGQVFKKVFDSSARKREDVFVTSKLWNTEHKKDRVRQACEKTLRDLQLEYLDLYLMHWGIAIPPAGPDVVSDRGRLTEQLDDKGYLITEPVSIRETWEAMEELVEGGLVKAIGVANFTAPMLIDLLTYAKITPAVLQVELHPYLQQQELVDFCQYKNIVVTAYSPLGSPGNYKDQGFPVLLDDPVITKLAQSHGKTAAQVVLRWGIQRGTVVIPKSVTPDRIKENIGALDFTLFDQDMREIAGLNKNLRFVNPSSWWKTLYFG